MLQRTPTVLRRRARRSICALGHLSLCLFLLGCGSPNKHYLLQIAPPVCAETSTRSLDAPVLVLRDFTTMPGMDRTAVFLARDNVIQPSTTWYWEGNPAEVMTQAVSDRLACEGPYRVSWPHIGRQEHAAALRGRVREFQVTRGDRPVFALRLSVELWSPKERELLGKKTIRASAEARSLSPQATAEAASQAVADATKQIATWLEESRSLVLD